jgi:hypothetical protein
VGPNGPWMRNTGLPRTSISTWRVELAALVVALLVVALAGSVLFRGARAVSFSPEHLPAAVGLYPPESFSDRPGSFRWTEPQASLVLPNPGGVALLSLELAAGAGRTTSLRLADAIVGELALGPEWRRYHLLAPAQPGAQLRLELEAAALRPANDPRSLGVALGAVSIRGGGAAPRSTVAIALMLALALYAAARAVVRPWGAGLFAAALSSALLGWHAAGWPEPPFAAMAALLGMIVAMAALGYRVSLAAGARRSTAVTLRRPAPAAPEAIPALLLLGSLVAYLGLGLWNHLNVHPGLTLDLGIYLEAGRAALAGTSPYATLGTDELVIGVSFVYPPASLPIFAAMARLDPAAAQTLWGLGNLALYLIALLSIYAALPGMLPRRALFALLVLGLGFAPWLEHLAIGQINSLMLLGLALFIHGQREQRFAWVGDFGLASVILIKLTPGLLLLWPLLRGDWPRLLRVGAAMVLLSLPSLWLFGLEPWLKFAEIAPQLLVGAPRNPFNQALVAQLTVLSAADSVAETLALGLGRAFTLLLLLVWAGLVWQRRRDDDDGTVLAGGVAVVTLASSLIWYHHLMFLVIPLAWLGLAGPQPWARRAALVALGLIQFTRLAEFGLGLPPWPAVAGYLILLIAMVRWLSMRAGAVGSNGLY